MRKVTGVVTGLLCLAVQGAPAAAAPVDALDETKVGVAAKFIPVKPGEFEMGSPAGEGGYDDEIQHRVKLTQGFELQATAVTQLQYFLVTGGNPSAFSGPVRCDPDNFRTLNGVNLCLHHPVEYVSWDEAQAFVAALNGLRGKCVYRLPTEAEREYAARGGRPARFPYSFGFNNADQLKDHAWYNKNSNSRTHAVASRKANPFGLYDMHGNVSEWVQDWYGDYPRWGATNPQGPATGALRVFRGGSWNLDAGYLRSASRNNGGPGTRWYDVGLRLARSCR